MTSSGVYGLNTLSFPPLLAHKAVYRSLLQRIQSGPLRLDSRAMSDNEAHPDPATVSQSLEPASGDTRNATQGDTVPQTQLFASIADNDSEPLNKLRSTTNDLETTFDDTVSPSNIIIPSYNGFSSFDAMYDALQYASTSPTTGPPGSATGNGTAEGYLQYPISGAMYNHRDRHGQRASDGKDDDAVGADHLWGSNSLLVSCRRKEIGPLQILQRCQGEQNMLHLCGE